MTKILTVVLIGLGLIHFQNARAQEKSTHSISGTTRQRAVVSPSEKTRPKSKTRTPVLPTEADARVFELVVRGFEDGVLYTNMSHDVWNRPRVLNEKLVKRLLKVAKNNEEEMNRVFALRILKQCAVEPAHCGNYTFDVVPVVETALSLLESDSESSKLKHEILETIFRPDSFLGFGANAKSINNSSWLKETPEGMRLLYNPESASLRHALQTIQNDRAASRDLQMSRLQVQEDIDRKTAP